ncbi:hypothetical protein A2J03_04315 [Rhodococcus sp. EPR-157]|nr:hypothetical protein A2J03_04315 [Rhodococcus sp. EPR-157]
MLDRADGRVVPLSAQVPVHLAATIGLYRFADRLAERGGEAHWRSCGRTVVLPLDAEDARRDVIAMLSEHAATDSNR